MKYCNKNYCVMNATMDEDFRLSPAGIAAIFQDCFASYMAKHHCAAFDLRREDKMWIISDFTFHMLPVQPFWGETVRVELWVPEAPAVKVYAEYRIWHKNNVVAYGDSTWAMLDIEKRTPIRANTMLNNIEVADEMVFGTHRHKQPVSKEVAYSHTHITNKSDADFNHHVTNMTYLYACLAALPTEYQESHTVTELGIWFKQESFIGESMECTVYTTEEPDLWNFRIVTAGERVSCLATIRYADKPEAVTNMLNDNLEIRQ